MTVRLTVRSFLAVVVAAGAVVSIEVTKLTTLDDVVATAPELASVSFNALMTGTVSCCSATPYVLRTNQYVGSPNSNFNFGVGGGDL